MSKNRTGAPPPASQSSESSGTAEGASAGPASSPEPANPAGESATLGAAAPSPPEPPPDTPVPPATERRRSLKAARDTLAKELAVEPPVAAFVLAYYAARGELPEDLVDQAKRLQSLPQVWGHIATGNYVGFRLACEFSGLPFVAPAELQASFSTIAAL